jgi:hydrogenase expression/formation protein HypE
MKNDKVLLGHGSGGSLTHDLISSLFVKHFSNPILDVQGDSALLDISSWEISMTTDSFVVDPLFFPGGDIGKLAIAGTENDIAVSGATPQYLSAAFILEEGLPMADLERIVISMATEAKKAGVKIVTGDTKVVERGKCDKVFINTTGIGVLDDEHEKICSGCQIEVGDKVLINGAIGNHGMAIMAERNDLKLSAKIKSDCACLNHMIAKVLKAGIRIKFMRDATRGGLSTVLHELVSGRKFGMEVFESQLKIDEEVQGICELLGFDPMYVANEGKVVMVVHQDDAQKALEILQADEFGIDAGIIGEIVDDHVGKAYINTTIGGKRILDMLSGEQLPRIC